MPRIRKKTSNRLKTNDRAKVLKKVKETKRKKVKAAKKNPQWKSKHKKDPGIPNDFPYKDQLLAEVAEQRRIAAEEKQRRKDEKKGGQPKQQKPDDEDESGSGSEVEEVEDIAEVPLPKGLNVGIDGIASLSARLMKGTARTHEVVPVVEEEEEEVPVLINRDLPTLQSVLDVADVIVEVLDARDPLAFRSKHVEELAAKKIIFVLNKIDACPREALVSWSAQLRTEHPTFLFRSASAFLPAGPVQIDPKLKVKGKGKAKVPTDDAVGVESILVYFKKLLAEKGESDSPLTVAVVGVTNVGKSSFINSILGKSALPVYTRASHSKGPTTTVLPQEVTLDVPQPPLVTPRKSVKEVTIPIRIIDTPGLSWEADEEADTVEDVRSRDILLRSKGRIDRLKDPMPPIAYIVSRANNEDLMLLYSLPAFAKGDPSAFLAGVARSNQLVRKKGNLDLTGAARIVLNDWSTGKFGRYTTPPLNAPSALTSEADIFTNDEAILANIPMRKEMRKMTGLVRFSVGKEETRKAAAELLWAALVEEEDSEEEGEEEGGMEVDEDGEDQAEGSDEGKEEGSVDENEDEEEEDDEEEEEEEEAPLPPISNKQKRKRGVEPAPAPPSKKVAFAPPPKSSKQARKAKAAEKGQEKPMAKKSALSSKPTKTSAQPPSALKKVKQDKVVNVATKKTKLGSTAAGEVAYDFGKFF